MCIKTDNLAVLALSDFATSHSGFLMYTAMDFVKQFPFVGHPHRLNFYLIFYCDGGSGSIQTDSFSARLDKGHVISIGPNSVCSIHTEDHPMEGWVILFTESFFSLRYNENMLFSFDCLKYNNVCHKVIRSEKSEEWRFHMKLMYREFAEDPNGAISIIRSHMNIVLSIINRTGTLSHSKKSLKTEKSRKYVLFEQMLESAFYQQKLPSFYAEQLHISVNYLNRICHEARGLSCGDIIRTRVVLEAERLLVHTFMSVSEIAFELGFDNISYFTTFFKKYNGLSPDSFRKANK